MPKISVIVPNFNHAKYLPQRLDSIFNQTFQDFEVILLDDCSTDNSREILYQYRNHPKVTNIVFNEQNSGSTFMQWDKGINKAIGEYIWIAESDDWCEPTLLETLINSFNKYPDAVLGYVQSYYIQGHNHVKWVSKQDDIEKIINGFEFIKHYLLDGNAIFNASMAVFKKSVYEKLDKNFCNYKFCGDWLFWIGISCQGEVFISGKILNYFRNHDADVSKKSYATGINFVEELQILFYLYDKMLISRSEFFSSLNFKHLNYKIKKNNFLPQITHKINTLFYLDEHTKQFKNMLTWNYLKYFMKVNIIMIIKRLNPWK